MGLVINPADVRPELMLPLKALAWWESGCGIAQTLETMDLLAEAAQRYPDRLQVVRKGSDIQRASSEGRLAVLSGLEGAHGLEGDLGNLTVAYQRGLRLVGLVHFQATAAGHPMTTSQFHDRGLTSFGYELIGEMERLGIVVDLAHLNGAGVADAVAVLDRPFVVSHTACRELHDHPRNLDDAQLKRIANREGLIGLAVGRSFIGGGGLDAFLDHADHALRVAGPDAVALGSDYDGFIIPERGMGDVRAYPRITQGLLRRGWAPEVVQKLLGANAVRVFTEVCG
jgi:membrane dipeptidase